MTDTHRPKKHLPALTASDHSRPLPLSFGQERLWFLDQLVPGNPFYNMSRSWRFQGDLDVPVLCAAINELVARHEVLRSRFISVGGVPQQHVEPVKPPDIEVHDVSGPDADERARAIAAEALARPFDLSSGRPLRFCLLRLADQDHVISVVVHHAVCDVWSLDIIQREVLALYRAMTAGDAPSLPPLPVQFGDFAAWQRDRLSPDHLESRLRWWREQLRDAPLVVELPTDHPRPPRASYRGVTRRFNVSAETTDRLRQFTQHVSATLFTVLLSAFADVIARWSGQDDVIVGVPMAGRLRPELAHLVGFFINTVPIRVQLQDNPPFDTLVSRVREAVLGGLVHQDVPFEALVEDLAPERDLSRSPLVQIAFQLMSTHGARPADTAAGGASPAVQRWKSNRQPPAHFDLSIRLVDSGTELNGEVVLASDLFDGDTAARVASWLVQALDRVAVDPSCRVSELPLSVAEEWPTPATGATPQIQGATLIEAFEAQARRTPGEAALRWPGGTLSYRELRTRARRLAARLRAVGVGREVIVGLCTESPDAFAVGLWGIMMASGAYMALDPDYPPQRLSAMASQAGASVIVAEQATRDRADRAGAVFVLLEDDNSDEGADTMPPAEGPSPSNLAYVAFTSGSAGQPKAVMVTHDHLVNYVSWCLAELPLGTGRVVPLASPVGFAGSILSLFGAWLSGRCLVMGAPKDPFAWCESVSEASFVKITPSALRLVAQRFGACWSGWGCVVLASEPIRGSDWEMVSGIPGLAVVAHYGLTETNGAAMWWSGQGNWAEPGLLGRPAAGAQLLVIDRWGTRAGPGTPGELYVGGRSVARGYLGQPGQTAERFIPNPYGPPGSRLYRTGDLVRWKPDGNLEFIGRIDDQIKIRGYRIEPGEVSAVLEEHPAVGVAVVAARADSAGTLQLVAWITATAGHDADPHQVRKWASNRLPDHLVPTVITVLDELPLNANGKLDRAALPEPRNDRAESEGPVTRPRTAIEQMLSDLWSEVLGRDSVSVYDNFFSIGGQSLLAIRLIFRVQEVFDVDYSLVSFFESPTIAAMAAALDEMDPIA